MLVVAPVPGSIALGVAPIAVIGLEYEASRVPVAALLVGMSVLIACAVMMSRSLGELPVPWIKRGRLRRQGDHNTSGTVRALPERTVAGVRPTLRDAPLQLEHVPLRRPARQSGPAPDIRQRTSTPDAMTPAERTIEHLLANDPDVLAGIIKDWLHSDIDSIADRTQR